MAKSNEPIWWSLFAAGGVVAALFSPVLMALTGVVIPLGLAGEEPVSHAALRAAVAHPLVKAALFAVIALPLFHWAHRFRFMLIDMGLQGVRAAVSVLCYGGAIVGTAATVTILWGL